MVVDALNVEKRKGIWMCTLMLFSQVTHQWKTQDVKIVDMLGIEGSNTGLELTKAAQTTVKKRMGKW